MVSARSRLSFGNLIPMNWPFAFWYTPPLRSMCLGRRGILIPDIAKLATRGLINTNTRITKEILGVTVRHFFEVLRRCPELFAQDTVGGIGQYVSSTSHELRLRCWVINA